MALRLEGVVNGRKVARTVNDPIELLDLAVTLLDGCALREERLMRILASLQVAAHGSRSWGWSAEEFELTMHPHQL